MKDGFVKVAAATPRIKVADCAYNLESIEKLIDEAENSRVKILVFPEMCLTGYTCGDLFYQSVLLNGALETLVRLKKYSEKSDMLVFVGLPLRVGDKIYNVAAAVQSGNILGIVPKKNLANYNEFYEKRQFTPFDGNNTYIEIDGEMCPFGTKLLFCCRGFADIKVGAEICEDLWIMTPPSAELAEAGATVIVNLSASNELIGKAEYRRQLVSSHSARLLCAYIYSDSGDGESTTDMVFAGHNIIAEDGKILKESELFSIGLTVSEIDAAFLISERTKLSGHKLSEERYEEIYFDFNSEETELTRTYPRLPFVPFDDGERKKRAELILAMQAHALKKRIEHVGAKTAVIGLSGGLDSTLALLAAVRAMKILNRPVSDVTAISIPCFGTSDRTYKNSEMLAKAIGVNFKVVNISAQVEEHLKAIGHGGKQNLTYENAQARERTQVLMDYACENGGLVVGTGDLSEIALGWSTYNGDHMSMYAVNSSVPKTLVKTLIRYEAERTEDSVRKVLQDILDTPISPELLPPENGVIKQNTEDIIGPYELHDFFLYHTIRMGFAPSKVLRIAKLTFAGAYTEDEIKKWLGIFIKRFFAQQFKRSCMPDGVKIGSVSLSPRADWRMPSDAVAKLWLED